jgi:hypothetical protein
MRRYAFLALLFAIPIFLFSEMVLMAASTNGFAWGDKMGWVSFGQADSWTNGYTYRRTIIASSSLVAPSGTSLTNFPMLISGTYSYLAATSSGGNVQNSNGYDIIFTSDSAGQNPLSYEVESYTSSTGAASYWVGMPTFSSSSRTLYVFYGKASVTSTQSNASATWNSNFAAVWHFNQNPAGSAPQMLDSTSFAAHGTAAGTAWTASEQQAGEISGALNYGLAAQYIDAGSSPDITSNGMLTTWIKTTSSNQWVFNKYNSGGSESGYLFGIDASGFLRFVISAGNNGGTGRTTFSATSTAVNDGNFHYIGASRTSGSQVVLYVDGNPISIIATGHTGSIAAAANEQIGRSDSLGYTANSWSGFIDEPRVLNAVQSNDWIKTEYNNQSSPSTFYSIGSALANSSVNVQVTTTSITGYAWSQNFGWINMAPSGSGVLNDGNGNLSGYAWGQNVGYINFQGVTIDSSGVFHGIASGTVAGRLQFDSSTGCTYCNVTSSWTTNSSLPLSVSSININGTNPASITLTPNTTTNVTVNATITDASCSLINNGTTTILFYRSGISSSTCLSNPNPLNCYVATAFTASSTCATTNINTTTTFAIQYYAQATDSSSSYAGQNWMGTVIFKDGNNTKGTADSTSASTTNSMATTIAFAVSTSSINYGTLSPGLNTGAVNQQVSAINVGNGSTTLQLSGTALTFGVNVLATSSQHYATSTFSYGGNEQSLSDSLTTVLGFSAIPPIVKFPLNGSWASAQALPVPIYSQASVAYNNFIYNIGGSDDAGNPTTTVLYASVSASGTLGTWNSAQSLHSALYSSASVVANGYIYNIGGYNTGPTPTAAVYFAPINATGSLGAWTSTQALPSTLRFHSAVAYNGYVYVLGGVNGIATSTVLYAPINATGSLGAWTSTQALPSGIYESASVVANGSIYVTGGLDINSIATSTVLYAPINATGSLGAWTSTQALPSGIGLHDSIISNGYLFNIGGFDGTSHGTSTVTYVGLDGHDTFWGVSVAGGVASGTYNSTVTYTALYSP